MTPEENGLTHLVPGTTGAIVKRQTNSLAARSRADLHQREAADEWLTKGLEHQIAAWEDAPEGFTKEQLQHHEMFKSAFRCFEVGLKLDPHHPGLHYEIGGAYLLGEGVSTSLEQAISAFLRAALLGHSGAQKEVATLAELTASQIADLYQVPLDLAHRGLAEAIVAVWKAANSPKTNLDILSRTVLVVDDEQVISDTLAMILAQRGFRTFAAYSGSTGLRRALELRPNMILSGVNNGDGPHGIAMAIRIREELPESKILLFSGIAPALGPLLEDAHARGHHLDLVPKPVHPNALLHWCELGGEHDAKQWCREQWASSEMAYPQWTQTDCTVCTWCRAQRESDSQDR